MAVIVMYSRGPGVPDGHCDNCWVQTMESLQNDNEVIPVNPPYCWNSYCNCHKQQQL